MKLNLQTSITAAAAMLLVAAGSATAALIVNPNKIVTGSATGKLVVIDVPFVSIYPSAGLTGGPDWTTAPPANTVTNIADNGFTTRTFGIREPFGTSPWEPDGTPISQAKDQGTFPTGNPNVSYDFSLAASGIDIPDGAVINAVYATWTSRGGGDGATYAYSEGAFSGSLAQTHTVAPTGNLVLSWIDAVSVTRNANFQRLFAGPIVVAGGDGFQLRLVDNLGNAAHIDAIVIDVTLAAAVPEPATATLGLLALGGLMMRRRRMA